MTTPLRAMAVCCTAVLSTACTANVKEQGESASTFDRVIKSGKIRAAYVVYPPVLSKDPTTGELSGIAPKVMLRAAESMGVEVEWVEEVGWSSMVEGVRLGRFDVVVCGIWRSASRAREADFTIPYFYSIVSPYARKDEQRFTTDGMFDAEKVNQENIMIATVDGEMAERIAKSDFPRAKRLGLTQMTDLSQAMMSVVTNKADLALVEPLVAHRFLQNNPGKLRRLASQRPLRLYGNTFLVPANQPRFKRFLDIALEEVINEGYVDKLLKEYLPDINAAYPVALPLQLPRNL